MRSPSAGWRKRRRPVGSTPSQHVVTLVHAAGCHLCDSARRVIEGVRAEVAFELEEVDISGDEELERSYRERIPVVLIDGREAFTLFVHPDGLRRRLVP
jgi:glutaredoxin